MTSTGTSLWPRLSPTRMTSGSCGTKTTVDEAPKHVTSRDHLNKVPRRLGVGAPLWSLPFVVPARYFLQAWFCLELSCCAAVRGGASTCVIACFSVGNVAVMGQCLLSPRSALRMCVNVWHTRVWRVKVEARAVFLVCRPRCVRPGCRARN